MRFGTRCDVAEPPSSLRAIGRREMPVLPDGLWRKIQRTWARYDPLDCIVATLLAMTVPCERRTRSGQSRRRLGPLNDDQENEREHGEGDVAEKGNADVARRKVAGGDHLAHMADRVAQQEDCVD